MALSYIGMAAVIYQPPAPQGIITVVVSCPGNVLRELLKAPSESRLPAGWTVMLPLRVADIDHMMRGGYLGVDDIPEGNIDIQVVDSTQLSGAPAPGAEVAHYVPALQLIDSALNGV